MEFINTLFVGPVLPATMFLGLLLLWNLLAVLGTVDLHMPHGDIDLHLPTDAHIHADVPTHADVPSHTDVHLDSSSGGIGSGASDGLAVLMMKWLNLKEVPLVLWMGILAVTWWFISAMLWTVVDRRFLTEPGWLWSSILVVRNLAIAIPLTKLATRPMRGWFTTERISAHSLIGQECKISSSVASPEFGQVKFKTEGSPLLLNVRTDGPSLAQGTPVWITHYDAKRRLYIVSPTTAVSASDQASSQNKD